MEDSAVQISTLPDSSKGKAKPAKKRIQTERRKMQNRESQRKYRENIKARLETLEREAKVSRGLESDVFPSGPSDTVSKIAPLPIVQPSIEEMNFFVSEFDSVHPSNVAMFDSDQDFLGFDVPLSDFSSSLDFDFMEQEIELDSINKGSADVVRFSENFNTDFFAEPDTSFDMTPTYQP
ncbi:hypothetical protein VTL71DRAFT_15126 [Oculimacula yallundae]|uniref:BZIP domain-containing protein n=1 Tax=Oculimacula yallundae TaxID=86028 RepID=A0ABR4CFS7_9HELO